MADPGNSPETFTLLQWAVGAGAVIGSSVAAFFGVKSRMRRGNDPELPARGGVEWFFDGPVIKIIEILQCIYRELKQQREDADRHADENNKKLDEQTAVLRAINEHLIESAAWRRPRR